MQAWPISQEGIGFEMGQRVRQAVLPGVEAFEALYRRHVGRVYAICRRLSGDSARAEELAQEVFIKAWTHLDSSRPAGAIAAWLGRCAINLALSDNRARRRRSRREEPVDDPERWDPPSRRPGPGAGLDLERAIDQLPPGARTVFVMHDVEGFRHGEIADMLGLSPGTTKAQLHRARRLLRGILTR